MHAKIKFPHEPGLKTVFRRESKVRSQLCTEFVKEVGLHEFIFIRNVEANDPLAMHSFRELAAKPVKVRFFHAKDDVGPANVPLGDHNPGIRLCSCRAGLVGRKTLEKLLCGETAKPVPTANEQQLFHHRK